MTNQVADHEKVYELLPWYVNRTLESTQKAFVSQHIDQCSECQREVEFLRILNNGIADDATDQYRMHADVQSSLSGVMDRIASEEQNNQPTLDSWTSRLNANLQGLSWRTFNLPTSQWAATAMVGVLVAGLGGMMYVNSSNDDYTALSSPDAQPLSLRLVVDIEAPEYEEPAREIIGIELNNMNKKYVIEENPEGSYIVVINDAISVSEVNDVINSLESNIEINKVSLLP